MAWIESHQEVSHHPKTRKLARRLDVGLAASVGHLHCLWHWALSFAPDGDLTKHDDDDVAIGALWEGDPKLFIDSLVDCGWLDKEGESLVIHDWWDFAGRLIEQREFQASRTRRRRQLYNDADLTREVRMRDGDNCRYCGTVVDWKDRRSSKGGTYDHVDPEGPNTPDNLVVACRGCNSQKGRRTPEDSGQVLLPIPTNESAGDPQEPSSESTTTNLTRPDLTKPEPDQTEPKSEAAGKPARARRANIVIAKWKPTKELLEWAAEKYPHVDLVTETEKFMDHFRANGKPMTDWDAAWKNWIRRSNEFAGSRS